jgi:hypothetical protein
MIKLPSGAKLEITLAPFADGKALYQAILDEAKGIKLNPQDEIDTNMWKDLMCVAFSSKKIEKEIENCFKRCLYNGKKIDADTFEPEEARQDYLEACVEVVKANVLPFVKSLYVKYSHILEALKASSQP